MGCAFVRKVCNFYRMAETRIPDEWEVPLVDRGALLDLHGLYKEVSYRGGIEKVLHNNLWHEVCAKMQLPPIASTLLQQAWMDGRID